MNDARDPTPPPVKRPEGGGSARRWLGLAALLGLSVTLVLPYGIATHRSAGPSPRSSADPRARAAEATAAIASLSSALGALAQVQARVQGGEAPVDPPDPANFDSPTACVRSYLPDVDLADGSMDPLCTEVDLWTTERTVDVRLAHRKGGAKHWTRLGVYSLAALATMRVGCCVSPEPLTAVLPGLWCGVLRDELRAFGPAPGLAVIAEYESMMRCLGDRGVRLPERWSRTSPEQSRAAFDEFLLGARRRSKE